METVANEKRKRTIGMLFFAAMNIISGLFTSLSPILADQSFISFLHNNSSNERFRKSAADLILSRNMNNFILSKEMGKANLDRDAYELFLKDKAGNDAFIGVYLASRLREDRTYEGQHRFWEIYLDTSKNGNKRWYRFYRMSRRTFRYIIRVSKPQMYPNPSQQALVRMNEETKSLLYIATVIRYLGSKIDQTQLAYDFGVNQGTISRRLRRGTQALLSTFHNEGCPHPKIRMPDLAEAVSYEQLFRIKTKGVRYILGFNYLL